jgi:acyl-coenzyme A thioesterase PaaI-like protein
MSDHNLQDRYAPEGGCFGCGPANAKGLRIKSRVVGQDIVCEWQPETYHEAFPGVLCGGIIGTLLDCHCNWAGAWHLMQEMGRDTPPCTVTAEYAIKLIRPTPTDGPVTLRAHLAEISGDRATIEGRLEAGGKLCATCTGIFVAVKPGHPAYHRW